MKNRLLSASLVMLLMTIVTVGYGQAVAPKIIVFPNEGWCEQNGFGRSVDDMGTRMFLPDYTTALRRSRDMSDMIGKLESILKDEGCDVQHLAGCLRGVEDNAAFDMASTSTKTGSSLAESPIDKLLSSAKPDIIVELGFEEMSDGPKKAIRFSLDAYDAYTHEPIDSEAGHGSYSSNSFDKVNQMTETVLSFKDMFLSKLMNHFTDMFENGRKVVIEVYRWDDCPIDFEEEIDDDELGDLVKQWMKKNTVKSRFGRVFPNTANRIVFDGARIPLYDENGDPIDAEDFAKGLRKFIEKTTKEKLGTKQPCKVEARGLGLARVTMGGK